MVKCFKLTSSFFSRPDTRVATHPTTGDYASERRSGIKATAREVAAVSIVSAIICLTIVIVTGRRFSTRVAVKIVPNSSEQLYLPRRNSAPRRQKIMYVSVQSRGQMVDFLFAAYGNRILSPRAIQLCYIGFQRINSCVGPPAAPTVISRRFPRIRHVRPPRARGAGRAGRAVLPWDIGSVCTRLRPL